MFLKPEKHQSPSHLVDVLLVAPKHVHAVVDDASRVAVSGTGDLPVNTRSRPTVVFCVEAEEDVAGGLIVTATPDQDLVIVDHSSVAVALVGTKTVVGV